MPARIVDFKVVVPADTDTNTEAKDYGEFKARVRDFETMLQIELRTDALIAARQANANEVGDRTRTLFTLMATFERTCETPPADFDAKGLMDGEFSDAIPFFIAYAQALGEAEERFRVGPKKAGKSKSVEGSA